MDAGFPTVKPPSACTKSELEGFAALVLAGGEASPVGLLKRVRNAHLLSFMRLNGGMIGVAGLKFPSPNHRNEVARGARVAFAVDEFPLELGWVSVLPSARGGKSYALCEPLVFAARHKGVFATTRAGNLPMHSTLAKLGFAQVGADWRSELNPDNLWLFLKYAA